MKIDMHCHVSEGSPDSRVSIREYIRLLIEEGFDGMVITDHNTYNGYRYWRDHVKGKEYQDFVVLKGVEYDTLDGGHMIVVMPQGVKLRTLETRGMLTEELIELVNRHGGIIGPAHPCGEKYMSFFNAGCFKVNPEITKKFHFIEVYNACEPESSNAEALEKAQYYNKLGVGGSDAHKHICVGWGGVEFEQDIKTELDLINAIRANVSTKCGGKIYNKTTKDRLGKAKAIMSYSFWVYNRSGEVIKRRIRKVRRVNELPVDPIDPIELEYIFKGRKIIKKQDSTSIDKIHD